MSRTEVPLASEMETTMTAEYSDGLSLQSADICL